MIRIVGGASHANAFRRIEQPCGRARDSVVMPLPAAFLYARQFYRGNCSRRLVRDQPCALSNEGQQQAPRQQLRRAEPSPIKKRTHKAKRLFYHVSAWWGRKPVDENPIGGREENSVVPSPASAAAPLFLGPNGLRAGWRFAVYVASVVALMFGLSNALRPLFTKSQGATPALWAFLIWECCAFLVAVLPALVLSHFEKRPFDDYGLPRRGAFGLNFWSGALWGLVAITCLLLMLRASGVFYFGGTALHGARVLKFAGFWAVMFTVVGLFEEFVTRGYSQFTLAQGIGFWPAAVLLSVGFGALHLTNKGEA